MRIASAGNTIVPAYLLIREKGYAVRKSAHANAEETWYAEKGDVQLIAEDPLTLLGLVALYEARGGDWKAKDEEIEAFVRKFQRDT